MPHCKWNIVQAAVFAVVLPFYRCKPQCIDAKPSNLSFVVVLVTETNEKFRLDLIVDY